MKRPGRSIPAWTVMPFWTLLFGVCLTYSVSAAADKADEPKTPAETAGDETATKTAATPKESPDKTRLPTADEMQVPTVSELLGKPPVDWIFTKRGEVLIVEPIQPRPNTLEQITARREALRTVRPRNSKEVDDLRKERIRLQYLDVVLPPDVPLPAGEEDAKFQLDIDKYIDKIVHHEDNMLRRADLLIAEGNRQAAFELLLALERRHPNWPGYKERRNRLLLEEAKDKFNKKQPNAALVYLEQLHGYNPGFRGLDVELGRVIDYFINDAIAMDDYRRARYYLGRLQKLMPQHAVVVRWKTTLLDRARRLIEQSVQATQDGKIDEAARLVNRAARVWPRTPDLRAVHRRANLRFQSLHVGVLDSAAKPSGGPVVSDADWRLRQLLETDLFEVDRIDELAHYRSRFFEEWEPTDLGREIEFELRQSRQPWESQRLVTTASIVSTLGQRLDPRHPAFDPRLASFVDSVKIRSPFAFTVRLSRVPVRPEPLFRFPALTDVIAARNDADTPADRATDAAAFRILSERFVLHEQRDDGNVYRRVVPESEGLTEYHVAEIIETRYDSYEKAVQAFLRDEVRMLPHVPPWVAAQFEMDERFTVRYYAQPTTHVLQFNPNSKALKNAEFRRALAFAIDREDILSHTVLKDEVARHGRLITAPFPSGSYATDPLQRLREYDRWLGVSLVLVAKKAMGGKIPQLKMLRPTEPIAREAAEKIVENWAEIGVTVTLIEPRTEPDGGVPDDWDIVYRRTRMTEPLTDLWPFLTMEEHARVESLMYLPDWLRQEVIELDSAVDWESAVSGLRALGRHLAARIVLIPLWEVDDALVVRKHAIRGLPEHPVHPYHDVERWIVDPWYPTELP